MTRAGARPHVIVGECGGAVNTAKCQALGWGRLRVARRYLPYAGERWAFDNGAFRFWSQGQPYDWTTFERQRVDVERMVLEGGHPPPLFGVVPDLVAEGEVSLRFSLAWLDRWRETELARLLRPAPIPPYYGALVIPWYLAVQDGMTPAMLEAPHPFGARGHGPPIICHVEGIFLGGTTAWKEATAAAWRSLVDRWGGRLHYARAGTVRKLRHAHAVGADSVDSALMLRSHQKFSAYATAWAALDSRSTTTL